MSASCKMLSSHSQWIICKSSVTWWRVLASYRLDGCSSLTFSMWSVISTVGYSCSVFALAPRLLARPAVWYHPKVSDAFGRRARVACPAVALCLGFCFMLRLAAISTGLWLFLEAGSFIEYLLMFQCELAHSSAFQIASALNGSAPCQEPLCTSLNLQLLIYSFNYERYSLKPVSDLYKHKQISKAHN